MASFERQMRNKQSHMFQSSTGRGDLVDPVTAAIPGPGVYETATDTLLKREVNRPRIVITSPTRNLDGAISVNNPAYTIQKQAM